MKYISPRVRKRSDLVFDGEQNLDTHNDCNISPDDSTIKRIHWRMSPTDREWKYGRDRPGTKPSIFFKELIFFFISSFLSFPLCVKIMILCFVYLDDYKTTVVNPSLRREDLPSCIIDLNLIPSFEPTNHNVNHIQTSLDHDQSCNPVNNKSDSPLIEIIVPPCNQLTKIQSMIKKYYKPMKLPLILHAYPPNFIDYLPLFNGGDHVAAKKHL
jgi:hypothetical protein